MVSNRKVGIHYIKEMWIKIFSISEWCWKTIFRSISCFRHKYILTKAHYNALAVTCKTTKMKFFFNSGLKINFYCFKCKYLCFTITAFARIFRYSNECNFVNLVIFNSVYRCWDNLYVIVILYGKWICWQLRHYIATEMLYAEMVSHCLNNCTKSTPF